MQRADSLEKTLMLGKIEDRRRRWQKMRRMPGVLQSMGSKESDTTEWLNWTEVAYLDSEYVFCHWLLLYSLFGEMKLKPSPWGQSIGLQLGSALASLRGKHEPLWLTSRRKEYSEWMMTKDFYIIQFSSVQLLSLVPFFVTPWLQHARPPCPSPTARVYPNPCPLSRWAYWAPTDLGSSSFSVLSYCLFILFIGFSRREYLSAPSPIPGVYSNSCLLSRWSHLTISSSVVPFSSRLQSFPTSGSFPMSLLFA